MSRRRSQDIRVSGLGIAARFGLSMGISLAVVMSIAAYIQFSSVKKITHQAVESALADAAQVSSEAERARRAKVINAEGEKQAAAMLADAAETLSSQKQALQLRYLQTLKEVAGEKTNTIIFPLPLDLIKPLIDLGDAINKDK